ncbi:MAG: FtsW/RodA/SpoVE family cell cycle protein [Lachnospiraceae bacterium]
MANILTSLLKYLILLICALYTLFSFMAFRNQGSNRKNWILNYQEALLFLFHLMGYFILVIQTGNIKILEFYVIQLIVIKACMVVYLKIYKGSSRLLLNNMFFLIVVGLMILTRLSFDKAVRQAMIMIIAFIVSSVVPIMVKRFGILMRMGYIYGVVGILCLSLVFVVGSTINGSTNWIRIGSVALQPSEFVKILFVFFLASMLNHAANFKQVAIVSVLSAIHVMILVTEKDLGGALLYFVIFIVMCYVATGRAIYFFGGLGLGVIASLLSYSMFAHVRNRIQAWSDPWSRVKEQGWQVAQSLFAIGTGGIFGTGFTQGRPTDIPVVEEDFIFSAISEEFGAIFAVCLILICLSIFLTCVYIAVKTKKLFHKLLAIGFGTCYIFQVFLTIGGAIKFIPSTGVTLPLISYGGSSVASTLLIFNIIQGLCMSADWEEEKYER